MSFTGFFRAVSLLLTMKYSYTSYPPDEIGKFVKRPMIEITIFEPNGTHKELALLDSGADRTLLNMEIARYLKIDLSRAHKGKMNGIVGGTEAFTTELEVQAEYLDKIKIPASFIETQNFGALLGEDVFFDLHKIRFEKDHNIFEINPVRK